MGIAQSLNPTASATSADAITGGTLNLTKTSTYLAAIGAILIGAESSFDQAFPSSLNPTAGVKAAVLIGIVAAWALIVAADILSRGYAHAQRCCSEVIPVPAGMPNATPAGGEGGWAVVAIRMSPGTNANAEFLLAKPGQQAQWVDTDHISFVAPQGAVSGS